MNNIAKSIAIWLVVALVLMTVFNQFSGQSKTDLQIKYSDFMQQVKDGRIATAQIDGRVVRGKMQDGKDYSTYAPNDLWMVNDLLKYSVQVEAKPEQQRSVLLEDFYVMVPNDLAYWRLDILYAPNARWRQRWWPILVW